MFNFKKLLESDRKKVLFIADLQGKKTETKKDIKLLDDKKSADWRKK